ncbi:MAG: DUF1636 domain-containing protein [Pseudomonadota bacterium]
MAQVELLVCTKCRKGQDIPDDATRPGAALHAELSARALPDTITLRAVECLSNCSQGCSVALRGGPARWTYVYGNLDTDLADTLIDGATRYAATDDGLVPWRERPEHLRKNCIARIPPQEL